MKKILKLEFLKNDLIIALACALLISGLLALTGFDAKCEELRENILRLHILANSDSDKDQMIKLKVRDKLLEASNGLYENLEDKEDAKHITEKNIEFLKSEAEEVVKQCGEDYSVDISVGKAYFSTREYKDFTLPAGEYDAVRVLIGEAKGKNWWCIMFPSLCIPSASDNNSLDKAVDEKSAEIAENAPKYKMEFKTVEIVENIKHWFKKMK